MSSVQVSIRKDGPWAIELFLFNPAAGKGYNLPVAPTLAEMLASAALAYDHLQRPDYFFDAVAAAWRSVSEPAVRVSYCREEGQYFLRIDVPGDNIGVKVPVERNTLNSTVFAAGQAAERIFQASGHKLKFSEIGSQVIRTLREHLGKR